MKQGYEHFNGSYNPYGTGGGYSNQYNSTGYPDAAYHNERFGPWFLSLFGNTFPQPPGLPPGRPPFTPPGPPSGVPPFAPPGQGQTPSGGPPSSPPPAYTPTKTQQVGVLAVDPGGIRGCLHRYTYVWLTNGQQFWYYPTFVGRRSIAGYRWTGFWWVYFGIDLRRIDSFQCV